MACGRAFFVVQAQWRVVDGGFAVSYNSAVISLTYDWC